MSYDGKDGTVRRSSHLGRPVEVEPQDLEYSAYSAFGAALLHSIGAVLMIIRGIAGRAAASSTQHGDPMMAFKRLDPAMLAAHWKHTMDWKGYTAISILVVTFSWLLVIPPILGLANVLGNRRSIVSLMVVTFAGAACLTVINLIFEAGTNETATFLANFIVNSTIEEAYSQEAIAKAGTIGYATVTRLQIITIADFIVRGRETWLFACVSLFQAVGLGIASLQTYRTGKFSRYWAHLGTFLACVGVLHFFIDLGREISWRGFSTAAMVCAIIEYLIGLPIWLVWLGMQFRQFESTEMASILNSGPSSSGTDSL